MSNPLPAKSERNTAGGAASAPMRPIFTIGHSTRPIAEFLRLLCAHGVETLIDVRTVPRSRHNPQFEGDALAVSLAEAGIGYQHEAALGGLRRPAHDSLNTAWRNASFRGFADYMQTAAFAAAVTAIAAFGQEQQVVLMCAEGNPARCHRSLIADALIARDIPCAEITSGLRTRPHRMTPFARVVGGQVTYPAESDAATS